VSEEGEGFDGEGYALTFTNPSETDPWGAQVAYSLDPTLEMESTYQVDFKARANASGTISAELQTSSDYTSDGFGSFEISEEWEEYSFEVTVTADDRDRLLFSYGEFAGTVYVDDITLSQVVEGGEVIEMTPEEKADTISAEMERWISGMMNVSSEYVNAWDVVNEPMDDGNPYELKTGEGAELADDEFYWQDYLGKDYAVLAFNLAREYGDDDDLLFINDYNLEYDLDKCKGIIEFVEYIEDNGATVDGIGTQMHLGIDSDKDKIEEMFELLAATGKLVKISELDIGVGEETGDATEEDYEAQAEMYKYVVEKYLEIVPAEQQYGITVWSPVDSPEGSAWRAGEPIGLWTEDYDRKRAYAAFANALAGEEVVELD
ncbi:MAG: endo-1,4-beta-xylanase, partial [Marinilabiliaceae bacterium]